MLPSEAVKSLTSTDRFKETLTEYSSYCSEIRMLVK